MNAVHFDTHPNDGGDWECQCARCGSSLMWEDCYGCAGEGLRGHDCGEDTCCCLDPEDNVECSNCGGSGGHYDCVSGREWCTANPMMGREDITSGRVEWYPVNRKDAGS
jgi:hypothetical protein